MRTPRRPVGPILLLVIGIAFAVSPALAAEDADETEEDGFRAVPSLGWSHGDHRVDLFLVVRYRWERWNARAPETTDFNGFRTRFGARYAWRDRIRVQVEGQHTAVLGLGPQSSGIGAAYFAFAREPDPSAVNVRQLFLDVRPTTDSHVAIGRQILEMGTWVPYPEADWRYVKHKRIGQRLVGIVGWTNGTRTYDGLRGGFDAGGHHVEAFAARPTRGVVDINGLFEGLDDVYVGGLEWTAPPGTLSDHLDFTGFFIGYADDRTNPVIDNDVAVYTLGGAVTGIFDLGPGRLDALLWGAFQAGHFREGAARPVLDHLAGALLAEVGYRLPDVYGQPWVRTGVNFGSGDDDPSDGDHGTFFNLLPTNHGYYGLVDQLAMQNLVDWFAQVDWSPWKGIGLSFFAHRFWLAERQDGRYFGTGVVNPYAPGYGSTPSQGSNDVGWETDIVLTWSVHRTTTLMAGYGQLFGGAVFTGTPNDQDVQWGFVQIQLSY